MSTLLRIRPTKIELIRLRRRLQLANNVRRILYERVNILINEFLSRIREAYRTRLRVNELVYDVYSTSVLLYGVYGNSIFDYFKSITIRETRVVTGLENIMGVKTKTAFIKQPDVFEQIYPGFTDFREKSFKLIEAIVDLGRAEQAVISLGREIERTRRKVNALTYIIIPRLESIIKYLRMKFEEREREEKARLKRVKSILERRRVE
ncbi:MAG: V-type ATP synthase subunit D [Desulfurococcaceae archaeon]